MPCAYKKLTKKGGHLTMTIGKYTMKRMQFVFLSALMWLQQGLLFAEGEEMPPEQGMWQTMIMVSIAFLFFYFLLMRPEQKRRKAMEDQRNALKKGDRVTAMGILGTILRVQEQTVILKMYDGSKIEVLKGAITDVVPGSEEDARKAEKDDKPVNNV
jgi:preprotein translocase subunit YajC